jgi:hypothetical protein
MGMSISGGSFAGCWPTARRRDRRRSRYGDRRRFHPRLSRCPYRPEPSRQTAEVISLAGLEDEAEQLLDVLHHHAHETGVKMVDDRINEGSNCSRGSILASSGVSLIGKGAGQVSVTRNSGAISGAELPNTSGF